ncbi:MAG: hypothetical protein LBP79_04450 [Clostridiales bacterium]|jgi:hypothetical protein|nr:hypothetical protein [Clostridiales bacterium]
MLPIYVRPRGHDYEKIVIKPTETSAGYTINLCKDCNYSYLSDFVTSGDEHFDEHYHEYSLFVARYDEEKHFILRCYCDCGEVDNSLVYAVFIDENGDYITPSTNVDGEVRYSQLVGDFNVLILSNGGVILATFNPAVEEEVIWRNKMSDTKHGAKLNAVCINILKGICRRAHA